MNDQFNVLSSDKWMLHSLPLETALKGRFYDVLPVNIHFSPALDCNYSCPHCTYGDSKIDFENRLGSENELKKEQVHTQLETMKIVFDRMEEAGLKRLIFSGGGEPLMNPDTIAGMAYATEIGLDVGLFTNGSLLSISRIDKILETNPSVIRISLNAGTEESHRLFHGLEYPHFQRVINNIRYLTTEKQRRKLSVEVSIAVIVTPLNFDTILDMSDILSDIEGINYLNIRPTINYANHTKMINRGVDEGTQYVVENHPNYANDYKAFFTSGEQFSQDFFDEVIGLANIAKERLKGKITVNIPEHKFEALTEVEPSLKECLASPWALGVGPDGLVYVCVEHNMAAEYCIGDLKTQSFSEILNSPKRWAVIDKINEKQDINSICGPGCMLSDLNKVLIGVKDSSEVEKDVIRKNAYNYRKEVRALIKAGKLSSDFTNII